MRTPNAQCEVCDKPLYRRPSEIKKARYFSCITHRTELQNKYPSTKSQVEALKLGRQKGTNHLSGIPKSKSSNLKRSVSHKKFWKENPNKLAERGKQIRGENHYRWNGGITKLNKSIRLMTENRRWADAVKERDGKCRECGSVDELEADHIVPLALLLETYKITNRDDARICKELWNVDNGMTLCRKCHYKKDERKYSDNH